MNLANLWSAVALGFFCGVIARILTPGDAFRHMSGPVSWVVSLIIGLLGSLLVYWVFTAILGIGDSPRFDWGGVVGALVGTVVVLLTASALVRRLAGREPASPTG